MTELPDQLTTLSLDAGILATLAGYQRTMGGVPQPEALAVLVGQVALETGNFRAMHCWNPGNRRPPHDWYGFFTSYRCDEIFDGATAKQAVAADPARATCHPWKDGLVRVVLEAGHPWNKFVAFQSAEDGFADYVAFLACNDRFHAAWTAIQRGDAKAAAHALHDARYFTADPNVYARGMQSIALRSLPACRAAVAGDAFVLTDQDREHIAGQVALSLDGMVRGPITSEIVS